MISMRHPLNPSRIGIPVTCAVCGNQKQPIGRSASPMAHYCTREECDGYTQEPHIGSLWPGESEMEFGYPVQFAGTRIDTGDDQ